jgi:hypothetical protein
MHEIRSGRRRRMGTMGNASNNEGGRIGARGMHETRKGNA